MIWVENIEIDRRVRIYQTIQGPLRFDYFKISSKTGENSHVLTTYNSDQTIYEAETLFNQAGWNTINR